MANSNNAANGDTADFRIGFEAVLRGVLKLRDDYWVSLMQEKLDDFVSDGKLTIAESDEVTKFFSQR